MTSLATPASIQGDRPRRLWRNRLFTLAMLFCMFVAFGTLAVLLVDTLITGWPAISSQLLTGLPSTVPAEAGARPAILATLYLGLLVLLFSVPIGVMTAIYLEEYANRERWWNRAIEVNIQNLAAVPAIVYGILGLAFIVRGIGVGRVVLAGGSDPHARRAADRRRRVSRGHSLGSGLDPAGRLRARRDEVAGRMAPGAAGVDPGNRHGIDPRALARGRRDGAADHGRRDHLRGLQPDTVRRRIRRSRCRSTTGRSSPTPTSRRLRQPALSSFSSSCSA